MFAGAPRVICSLWKVDDDATRALMIKFYELWNPKDGKPGLPTATALKQAQEYIRTHEIEVPDDEASQREGHPVTKRVRHWEHPYYWAAWVLWGLPS
jgi:CHAT domain-containing protein